LAVASSQTRSANAWPRTFEEVVEANRRALLDLWFFGDLREAPTLGGHLTKIISGISHRRYRFTAL